MTILRNTDDCYYDYDVHDGYVKGATDQRQIDIDKLVKWAEKTNETNKEIGIETRIDIESFRKWITDIFCE